MALNFAGLTLDAPDESFASSSAVNSSESVFFFKPSLPFERYDLTKDFHGSGTSINLEELEQSPAAPFIENFLEPWLQRLRGTVRTAGAQGFRASTSPNSSSSSTDESSDEEDVLASVADVAASLTAYARSKPTSILDLLEALHTSRLLVPYLDLDLPGASVSLVLRPGFKFPLYSNTSSSFS